MLCIYKKRGDNVNILIKEDEEEDYSNDFLAEENNGKNDENHN